MNAGRGTVMRRHRSIGLFLLLIFLTACGGGGGGSSDAPGPGRVHEDAWIITHDERARQDLVGCQVCHGLDFQGNAGAVSCMDCHFGAPPFVKHPPNRVQSLPWGNPVNHGFWAEAFLYRCQGCHAGRGGPGSNPRFIREFPGMELGCESAVGCHDVGNEPFPPFNNGHNPFVAHPSFDPNDPSKQDRMHWYGERVTYRDDAGQEQTALITHINAGNVERSCTPCHGAALEGGVGPACTECHVTSPVTDSFGCISCHGRPVGPTDIQRGLAGRQAPLDPVFLAEVARGFHLMHAAIPPEARDEAADCQVCHSNQGTSPDDPRTNVNRHHLFLGRIIPEGTVAPFGAPGQEYGCGSCHRITLNPFNVIVPRDCEECHENFFNAPPGVF